MVRPVSNLKASRDFALSAAAMRSGFVAAWRSMPAGSTRKSALSPVGFYTHLIYNSLFPATRGLELTDQNALQKAFRDEEGTRVVKSVLRRDLGLKRFLYTVPVYTAPWTGDLEDALQPALWFTRKDDTLDLSVRTEDTFINKGLVTGHALSQIVDVDPKAKALIAQSIQHVQFTQDKGILRVSVTWIITKEEVEYLNNAPFVEVKFATFYPILLDWAGGVMGQFSRLPETVTSISKITQLVGKSQESNPARPRVGVDGLVIDIQNRLFQFPEVNNSQQYEQLLTDFGLQEDGSYTWRPAGEEFAADGEINMDQLGEQLARRKLPVNIPVFTDWVNDKFAYSNTVGKLSVFDLGSTVPARKTHIRNLLDSYCVKDDKAGIFTVLSSAISVASSFDKSILTETGAEDIELGDDSEAFDKTRLFPQGTNTFHGLISQTVRAHKKVDPQSTDLYTVGGLEVPKLYDLNPVNGIPTFRYIGRILHSALRVLESNKEAALTRYSVLTVYQILATLKIFATYGSSFTRVVDEDEVERSAYLEQELDPSYQPEGLPNIRKDLKYLPHQFRTQNRMRKGPAFAVWAVQAGGGKSILTLTNILNELKNGRAERPIITCPPHLISNYVKEVVFVTEGKLNIIPITNQTLKVHGYEHLQDLILKAPKNSVVITDFNFLKGKTQQVSYGNKTLNVFQNAEFLRQFEFDLIVVDEVHYLKNLKSIRRDAAARFMQDIPMKRIASGTLIHDTLVDLVSQVALLDPTIFGSQERFIKTYADEVRGSKVLSWKKGAEAEIRHHLEQHVVFAQAKRKEWAAALPESRERFIGIDLTDQQRLVYESVLAETTKLIEEAMKKDPKLAQMMEDEDESVEDALESKLRPYLARLERFLSNPEADILSADLLKDPKDRVSPKATKIYSIIREHLAGNMGKNSKGEVEFTADGKAVPGKVLIFTQYTLSAEHVYENAPPDLKPLFIHYTATEKEECRVAFEKDPNKIVMIGVSSSMDTGLNFQHVSRLIRMETVWTPGVLEQGNSRINRPELKKQETRNRIFFDWLAINRTVDITKVARLVSKVVSAAKFDEHDDPNYQNIKDLPKIPMKLDSIRAQNSFEEELLPYLQVYDQYQKVRKADYAQYVVDNPNSLQAVAVPTEGNLGGSKLLSRIPYVPDMAIYGTDKLGLVRYDEYLRIDQADLESDDEDDGGPDDEEDDDDGPEGEALDPKAARRAERKRLNKEELAKMKDRPVHTELGDGIIYGVSRSWVGVRFPDGSKRRLNKMRVFVINRADTNGIDLRNELLKQVGDIPMDTPIQVPAQEGKADKKRRAKAAGVQVEAPPEVDNALHVAFDITIINDFATLMFAGDSEDTNAISALQNFGFQLSPEYVHTRVRSAGHLLDLFRAFRDKGFSITPEQSATFKFIYDTIKGNQKGIRSFGLATQLDIQLFHKERLKPSTSETRLKVYPIIQDGMLYVAMPLNGQAATRKAMRVKPPGVQWHEAGGSSEIVKFFKTKKDLLDTLRDIINSGVVIDNLKVLKRQYESLKMANR